MAIGIQVWSKTAASNANADGQINWAEGMAPSQVNDSARGTMASAASWRDDNNGTLVTSGSSTAFTVASNQVSSGLTGGYTIAVQFHAQNDVGATLNVDGTGAKPILLANTTTTGTTGLYGQEFAALSIQSLTYTTSNNGQWIAKGNVSPGLQPNIVNAANLSLNSVGYTKIQNETDNTMLGNVQGANWPPQEIVIGKGLVFTTTSTSTAQAAFTSTSTTTATPFTLTAPAFPPTSAFKNLSIKVTGVTSATATADFVTLATSGSTLFGTVALPATPINFGATGAAALDTGSLASGTWYAIWAIANAGLTSVSAIASASFSSPTMPSSYVYKARIGAVVTATSTASAQLMGTFQFGRQAQYVNGLAATTPSLPTLVSSGSGNVSTPVWTTVSATKWVPTTASVIRIIPYCITSNGSLIVAPSTSYGSGTSATNSPPISFINNGGNPYNYPVELVLESTNIYFASNGSTAGIFALGWQDNI